LISVARAEEYYFQGSRKHVFIIKFSAKITILFFRQTNVINVKNKTTYKKYSYLNLF